MLWANPLRQHARRCSQCRLNHELDKFENTWKPHCFYGSKEQLSPQKSWSVIAIPHDSGTMLTTFGNCVCVVTQQKIVMLFQVGVILFKLMTWTLPLTLMKCDHDTSMTPTRASVNECNLFSTMTGQRDSPQIKSSPQKDTSATWLPAAPPSTIHWMTGISIKESTLQTGHLARLVGAFFCALLKHSLQIRGWETKSAMSPEVPSAWTNAWVGERS